MKRTLVLLLSFLSISLFAKTYYLSPTGNDSTPGTISDPFFTLNKAWTAICAGDTVFLRGGTYYYNATQFLTGKSGTNAQIIKIWAYPGEKPIITKATNFACRQNSGIYFSGNYFHWKDIEITGFSQYDAEINTGFKVQDSNHNFFELLNSHHNGHGMIMAKSCDNNLILNSDFHHNSDPLTAMPYENADGLEICYIPSGLTNRVKGCRFWWNSDDGIDLWLNDGTVIIDSCWSWNNGYIPDTHSPAGNGVGFKLGKTEKDYGNKVLRQISNCIAFDNRTWGFHQNGANAAIDLHNNTACMNGAQDFCLETGSKQHIVKNNISHKNANNPAFTSLTLLINNTFLNRALNTSFSVEDSDFLSLDGAQLLTPRRDDGSLPYIDFLHLAPGSDLIDAGADAQLPFYGEAPDIGAFEIVSGELNTNQLPTINISIPIKSDSYITPATITVNVEASDPDGTITKLELYNGKNKIGTSLEAPYSFTLKDLPVGSYSLKAIVFDNLKASSSSAPLEFKVISNIENPQNFNLYPNPNNGFFTVDFTTSLEAEILTVTVFDLIGNPVYQAELSKEENTRQFDLSHLHSGTYIMVISADQILLTQKFIKG